MVKEKKKVILAEGKESAELSPSKQSWRMNWRKEKQNSGNGNKTGNHK